MERRGGELKDQAAGVFVSLSEIMKVKFAEGRLGMVNQKEKRFGIGGHSHVKSSDIGIWSKYLDPVRRE